MQKKVVKVELELIKEIAKNSQKSENLLGKAVKEIGLIKKSTIKAIEDIKNSLKLAEKAYAQGKEIERLADNIGADLKGETEKSIQNAFDTIEASTQMLKDLNRVKNIGLF